MTIALQAESSRHRILGLSLDPLPPPLAVDRFMQLVRARGAGYCCVTNVHQCVLVHDDAAFRARVNAASLVISDSTVLQRVVASQLNLPFVPPLRGAELMLEICRRAEAEGMPIALIGGRTPAALEMLADQLQRSFPRLRIAYAFSPPFEPATADATRKMLDGIRLSSARICFVGLGCPKQENWMAEHTAQIAAMLIGVGAAFDINAGIVRSSPPWMHRVGLEWLYRLLAEPHRLWRRHLTTSPRFLWLVAKDMLRK